jgi:integrase
LKSVRAANVGVAIEQSGNRLYLRATLPPKPGATRHEPYQQRISLSSQGIRANPIGIKEAEAEARKVGALLARREFDWQPYLKSDSQLCLTIADWLAQFEADYFTRKSRTPQSETTWRHDYLKVFNKLPKNVTLSVEILKQTILSTAPDTRTRRRTVMVLTALAKFADVEVNFKSLAGSYSPRTVAPRELPDDRAIATWFNKIPAGCWRWAYGILATYGLRNHELFHLDFSKFPVLLVQDGKTGSRRVYPIYPEWAIQWELENVNLPRCTGKTNSDLGNRVTHAFKRLDIPFNPYDLRHAWAVRSLEFGLDVSLAAAQMGHSVQVHTDLYHHWISEEVHQRAFNILLNRPDRPHPPEISLPKLCLKI